MIALDSIVKNLALLNGDDSRGVSVRLLLSIWEVGTSIYTPHLWRALEPCDPLCSGATDTGILCSGGESGSIAMTTFAIARVKPKASSYRLRPQAAREIARTRAVKLLAVYSYPDVAIIIILASEALAQSSGLSPETTVALLPGIPDA